MNSGFPVIDFAGPETGAGEADAGVIAAPAQSWPAPPYLSVAAPASGALYPHAMVLTRRVSRLEGRLVEFLPEARVVQFNLAGSPANVALSYDDIEILTLAEPVAVTLLPDQGLEMQAGDRVDAHAKPFLVEFNSGNTLEGDAAGAVVVDDALFLLELFDTDSAIRHFIPLTSIRDYRLGAAPDAAAPTDQAGAAPHGPAVPPPSAAGGLQLLEVAANSSAMSLDAASASGQSITLAPLEEESRDLPITNRADLYRALKQQRAGNIKRLGTVLIEMNLVTSEQLDRALEYQKLRNTKQLGQALIDMGVIDEQTLKRALPRKMGIPFVDLYTVKPDLDAVRDVSLKIATQYHIMPVGYHDEALVVAFEDPFDPVPINAVRFATGRKVVPVITTRTQIDDAILRYYQGATSSELRADLAGSPGLMEIPFQAGAAPIGELAGQLLVEGSTKPLSVEDRFVSETDTTLVRLVNTMIIDAHQRGVSDIHIESHGERQSSRIRFRQDGILSEYIEVPHGFRQALVTRVKIMADLDISEHRRSQDGKIAFSRFGPLSIELRVAVVPTINGLEDIVLRLLSSGKPVPLESLGIASTELEAIKALMLRPYGIFLACGPTGSGKTTTLHSLLSYINTPERKIWTAEDPVEITQPGLRQVQMHPKIGWTFAAALRSFLRADPDVIMVGEMRDAETAKIAIEAALTGHLVLSTLHTNGTVESISRLLEMGMDTFHFADSLLGLIAQRLVRRLCRTCFRKRQLDATEIEALAREFAHQSGAAPGSVIERWMLVYGEDGTLHVHDPVGCPECNGKGYKGRLGVYETLIASPGLKRLMRASAQADELRQQVVADGMVFLRQDGINKVLAGLTTMEQVRAATG